MGADGNRQGGEAKRGRFGAAARCAYAMRAPANVVQHQPDDRRSKHRRQGHTDKTPERCTYQSTVSTSKRASSVTMSATYVATWYSFSSLASPGAVAIEPHITRREECRITRRNTLDGSAAAAANTRRAALHDRGSSVETTTHEARDR